MKTVFLLLLISTCLMTITSENTDSKPTKIDCEKGNMLVNFIAGKLDAITGSFLTKYITNTKSETIEAKPTSTDETGTTSQTSITTTYLVIILFSLQYIASIVIK